jgi:hypothetical protein
MIETQYRCFLLITASCFITFQQHLMDRGTTSLACLLSCMWSYCHSQWQQLQLRPGAWHCRILLTQDEHTANPYTFRFFVHRNIQAQQSVQKLMDTQHKWTINLTELRTQTTILSAWLHFTPMPTLTSLLLALGYFVEHLGSTLHTCYFPWF